MKKKNWVLVSVSYLNQNPNFFGCECMPNIHKKCEQTFLKEKYFKMK